MTIDPLLSAPLAVQLHASTALAAAVMGAVILFRPKGTPLHRWLCRAWAVLMLVTATSALFINEIRLIGPFSPIHLFSILTYFWLVQGIWHIRHGNVAAHRFVMQSLYLNALGLAGAFTLLPGRRMNQLLFGPDAGWLPSLVAIGLVLAAVWFFHRRFSRRRSSGSVRAN